MTHVQHGVGNPGGIANVVLAQVGKGLSCKVVRRMPESGKL